MNDMLIGLGDDASVFAPPIHPASTTTIVVMMMMVVVVVIRRADIMIIYTQTFANDNIVRFACNAHHLISSHRECP
jgi:hypothetical protein